MTSEMAYHAEKSQEEGRKLKEWAKDARLVLGEFEANSWDGDPIRRLGDETCQKARALIARLDGMKKPSRTIAPTKAEFDQFNREAAQ